MERDGAVLAGTRECETRWETLGKVVWCETVKKQWQKKVSFESCRKLSNRETGKPGRHRGSFLGSPFGTPTPVSFHLQHTPSTYRKVTRQGSILPDREENCLAAHHGSILSKEFCLLSLKIRFFPNVSPRGFVRGKREKRWTLQRLKKTRHKLPVLE